MSVVLLTEPFSGGGSGSGTVTSVDVSGGTTGLTTSGGPVTTAGVITLAGVLNVANGGTGTATPGLVAGTNVTITGTWPNQTINSSGGGGGGGTVTSVNLSAPAIFTVTGSPVTTSGTLTLSYSGTALPVANGGTGATTLTGYVYGNGTSAMTASTSIPTAALSGTVTNAQLANNSITLGSTAISLGATASTLDGLASVAVTADPTTAFQLATKQYVDGLVSSGLVYHQPVQVATTASLASITGGAVTYNQPGGAGVGVGATLTLSVALTVLDGYTLLNTNRILVKDEVNQAYNGVYTWATGGTVLTRSTDTDTYGSGTSQLSQNDYFFTQNGTINKGTSYVVTTTGTITFGSTNIVFAEFSNSQVYTGTAPVNVSGTVISLNTAYGDTQNPYASKTANYVLASPDGISGVPTFRAIVAADIPTLNQNTTGTAANVTGTVAVANGGTGATALTGVLKGNGTSAFTAATAGTDYQAPIALTTTGSSGAATFVGNTLNIPIYTGGGSSGPILESYRTISQNYTITTGSNGFSVGPVVIAAGFAVTVPTVWRIDG
jgi:hypothetical protein